MTKNSNVDIPNADIILTRNHPGVTYSTLNAVNYYNLPNRPHASSVNISVGISSDGSRLTYRSEKVTETYLSYSSVVPPQSFLNGRIAFFYFDENLDPGKEPTVNRLAILGMTKDDKFGFLRVIDYLSNGLPPTNTIDFRTIASDGHGAHTHINVEVGSPASLG